MPRTPRAPHAHLVTAAVVLILLIMFSSLIPCRVGAAIHAGAVGNTTRAATPSTSLTVVVGNEPASLDPAVDYETGGATYLGNVYEGLVRAVGDRTAAFVPVLATTWQQSGDGRTWTFRLRPHVHFHDGSTLDAAAVKFSFQRLLTGNQGAVADFAEIASIDVVDPLTVRFHLRSPFASFLASMTSLWGADIVSPKTVGNTKIAANGSSYLADHDAGSGPYELASYQRGQKIVLKAFPGYWGGWGGSGGSSGSGGFGARHLRTVTIQWTASSSTQRVALEQGEIDATMNLSAQDFAALSDERGVTVVERTAQTIRDIRFNTAKDVLHSKLVRQALSYAFDYDGVIRGVYEGHATRMRGVGPTGLTNFVPAAHPYTFDLARARALLAQAGYTNKNKKPSFTITIAYLPDDTQAGQIGQLFQADLAKIGVMARLRSIPVATYARIDQKPSTNPDIWISTWAMDYNDNAQQYWAYFYSKNTPPVGGNVFYYADPTTDRLLIQARQATDSATAYRLYQQVCDRVYDQALEIWPAQPNERVALRDNVHGYQYNVLYSNYYYPLYTMYKA